MAISLAESARPTLLHGGRFFARGLAQAGTRNGRSRLAFVMPTRPYLTGRRSALWFGRCRRALNI